MRALPARLYPALCASLTTLACAAPATAQSALAEQRYARGIEHYRAGRFREALEEFRASLTLRASPNTRLMQARCLRNLGAIVDAAIEYDRVIRDGSSDRTYAQSVAVAAREHALILEQLARVRLEYSPADESVEIAVDGAQTTALAGRELLLSPGAHELRARWAQQSDTQRVVVRAGQTLVVRFGFSAAQRDASEPPPPFSRVIRGPREDVAPAARSATPFWVAGAVTGALSAGGWVTFAIAAVQSEQLHASLQRACASGCPSDLDASIERGRSLDLLGNIGFTVGVTMLLTSASVWIAGALHARPTRLTVSAGHLGVRF